MNYISNKYISFYSTFLMSLLKQRVIKMKKVQHYVTKFIHNYPLAIVLQLFWSQINKSWYCNRAISVNLHITVQVKFGNHCQRTIQYTRTGLDSNTVVIRIRNKNFLFILNDVICQNWNYIKAVHTKILTIILAKWWSTVIFQVVNFNIMLFCICSS